MLENCVKIMHYRFNFDACLMHSPFGFGFVQLTHQNLSVHALFCHISLTKENTQLLIYNYQALPHLASTYQFQLIKIPFQNFITYRSSKIGISRIRISLKIKQKPVGFFPRKTIGSNNVSTLIIEVNFRFLR